VFRKHQNREGGTEEQRQNEEAESSHGTCVLNRYEPEASSPNKSG
jgi:hypothetical protein